MMNVKELMLSTIGETMSDKKTLIGKVVQHEGSLYQILSEGETILMAHSYDENCFIKETIMVSKSTGKVVARKQETPREKK